jgi:hypothetical protein
LHEVLARVPEPVVRGKFITNYRFCFLESFKEGPPADHRCSSSCSCPSFPSPPQRRLPNISGDTKKNRMFYSCWGTAGGGARHSGALMLRRYATTSAFLQ